MPPPSLLRCLLAGVTLLGAALDAQAESADLLDGLRSGHPRLLASVGEWNRQIAATASDRVGQHLATHALAAAVKLQTTPVVIRELDGRRLLPISREVVRRVLQLVAAYRISGDEAHVRRAEQELLAVAAFADWNPSHFLDVAEMTTAVAIGYDEFFAQFSAETRAALRQAIVTHGILPGIDPDALHNSWHRTSNNWNQVCWTGLVLGGLAIAEDEPGLARQVLQLARDNVVHGMRPYVPDGLYPEGPGYWSYGTTYQVIMIEALRHALGDDWNLPASPGFLASAESLTMLTGPTGVEFNFSDSWESRAFAPALLWFARESPSSGLMASHQASLDRWSRDPVAVASERFSPLALLWRTPQADPTEPHLPLSWRSQGEQPVAVLRSGWSDPAATWIAAKGGSASLNHAHMDAGSFVLEAHGVRWAGDLGAQNYTGLEAKGVDLWNRSQESGRWTVFRLNNRSHNTLVIDNQLQNVAGHAGIARFSADDEPFVVFDLSSVYAGQATTVHRGFRLDRERRVLVQDEVDGLRPGADVRWAVVTEADITLAPDGGSARLDQAGRSLRATVLSPDGVRFGSEPAAPPADDFNAPNPGRRLLVLHASAPASGTLQFVVVLTPGSVDSATDRPPRLQPLMDW